MPKTSAARLGKRAWNFIGQIDTLAGLVGWIGACLGSILASRVMNPANIFVPLSWFFGTILVIVSTVKLLNLLWSKRDQFPWIKRHGDSAAQLELERRLLGTAESDAAFLDLARERDALSKELKACKVKFSHAKLHWIAERQVLSGDEDAIVDVVVRFAGSSDYFIANNIKKIIEGHETAVTILLLNLTMSLRCCSNPTLGKHSMKYAKHSNMEIYSMIIQLNLIVVISCWKTGVISWWW